jgi:hypothetical protein
VDYLRGEGRGLIDELFSTQHALWDILDRERTRAIWRDFVRAALRTHY